LAPLSAVHPRRSPPCRLAMPRLLASIQGTQEVGRPYRIMVATEPAGWLRLGCAALSFLPARGAIPQHLPLTAVADSHGGAPAVGTTDQRVRRVHLGRRSTADRAMVALLLHDSSGSPSSGEHSTSAGRVAIEIVAHKRANGDATGDAVTRHTSVSPMHTRKLSPQRSGPQNVSPCDLS
jgi:hypothetical protein